MKTSSNYTADYKDELTKKRLERCRLLLSGLSSAAFDQFISEIRHPLSLYWAERRVHAEITSSTEQQRYYKQLKNKAARASDHLDKLQVELESAPVELGHSLSDLGVQIRELQNDLSVMAGALLELHGIPKSQSRPEIERFLSALKLALEDATGKPVTFKFFKSAADIPRVGQPEERLTELASELMGMSPDSAARAFQKM